MHNDIHDLHRFYDSPLGHVARLDDPATAAGPVAGRCAATWFSASAYATPYLGPFVEEAERTLALDAGPARASAAGHAAGQCGSP